MSQDDRARLELLRAELASYLAMSSDERALHPIVLRAEDHFALLNLVLDGSHE